MIEQSKLNKSNDFLLEESQEILTTQIINEERLLSEKEIESSLCLARVLERAHNRLLREGYTIEYGKIYRKDEK